MAKKKVAAKKSTNNKKTVKSAKPVKKAVKKAAKPSPKKVVKKAKPAKTAKPAVKAKSKKTTKAAPKAKVSAKSKAPVKASAKTAKATKSAKPAKASKPAKPSVSTALVRPSAPAKKLDLSNFVTPLDDRLMVQLSETERMTPGGLFIPDTVADTSGNLHGIVVAVGRGHFSKKGHLQPMDVKVGDKVVFAKYSGSKIKIQNEDLIILRESDVMGVVTK